MYGMPTHVSERVQRFMALGPWGEVPTNQAGAPFWPAFLVHDAVEGQVGSGLITTVIGLAALCPPVAWMMPSGLCALSLMQVS